MTHDTYFELAPRARLKPNPQNPKVITEADVAKMVDLIRTFGFKDPVEARHEDGLIVAGHRRLLAADKLGLTVIPTNFHVGMSDEEATAYTIAHTRAEDDVDWNRALLSDQIAAMPEDLVPSLGFAEAELDRLFDLDRGQEEEGADGGPEDDAEPRALLIPGEVWTIGPVTFNVFKGLDNSSLNNAEKVIRKIAKMLKCKALLDGDDTQPLDAVLRERGMGV